MAYNIAEYSPQTGRMIKDDGSVVNLADILYRTGATCGYTGTITTIPVTTGRVVAEDSTIVNIADETVDG